MRDNSKNVEIMEEQMNKSKKILKRIYEEKIEKIKNEQSKNK